MSDYKVLVIRPLLDSGLFLILTKSKYLQYCSGQKKERRGGGGGGGEENKNKEVMLILFIAFV